MKQSIESKKEEFSKYLLNSHVIDDLTEALISLYEEEKKADNPTEYIKTHLKSINAPDGILLEENKKLKDEAKKLKKELQELQKKLEQLQRPNDA